MATKKASSYKIIRSVNAGVFAGDLVSLKGDVAVLKNARRIWYWDGAATLSQLALDGTSKPENCKFPAPISVTVLGVIEVIDTTAKARASIAGVRVWKK